MSATFGPVSHFSLTNPQGAGQGNVAALLRRLADLMDAKDLTNIQDIAFNADELGDPPWPCFTVYHT